MSAGSVTLGKAPNSGKRNMRTQRSALRAKDGGADRARTCDLLIANETLYQLSYDPIKFCINELQPKLLGNEFPLLYGTSILYREKHGKPLTSW